MLPARVFARRLSSGGAARVAFLGLGKMGSGMASNLVKAGHDVAVYDVFPDAVKALADEGARPAETAEAAVEGAGYVVSMLPTGAHSTAVYIGEGGKGGLLSRLDETTTVLDCSTIDAATARTIGAAAAERGIGFMDAPVSGGVAAAASGNLAFMCGGEAATFAKAEPVLQPMAREKGIFHAGPAGAGQVAKACNNMLLAIHMIGSSEALEMGTRAGLDAGVLSEILLASSGKNWSLEVYNPYPGVMPAAPASNGYAPGFTVDLMLKDLKLAAEAANDVGFNNSLGSVARELYEAHQAEGSGALDFSSILQKLQKLPRN